MNCAEKGGEGGGEGVFGLSHLSGEGLARLLEGGSEGALRSGRRAGLGRSLARGTFGRGRRFFIGAMIDGLSTDDY